MNEKIMMLAFWYVSSMKNSLPDSGERNHVTALFEAWSPWIKKAVKAKVHSWAKKDLLILIA